MLNSTIADKQESLIAEKNFVQEEGLSSPYQREKRISHLKTPEKVPS